MFQFAVDRQYASFTLEPQREANKIEPESASKAHRQVIKFKKLLELMFSKKKKAQEWLLSKLWIDSPFCPRWTFCNTLDKKCSVFVGIVDKLLTKIKLKIVEV